MRSTSLRMGRTTTQDFHLYLGAQQFGAMERADGAIPRVSQNLDMNTVLLLDVAGAFVAARAVGFPSTSCIVASKRHRVAMMS